jgi:pyruvate kinase
MLGKMMQAGADIFRFNMSHGSHESHGTTLERVRHTADRLDRPVGILVDLQGPKIRTGLNVDGEKIRLNRHETVRLAGGSAPSRPGRIVVDFPPLLRDLRRGDRVLLDDGRLVLRIGMRKGRELEATVIEPGILKERAGVNVPGRRLAISIPTPKDRRDVAFALEQGADFIALSFVQSGEDIRRLRRLMGRLASEVRGQPSERRRRARTRGMVDDLRPLPLVVAKIEKPAALRNLDDILDVVDGVMVARGDLGVELSVEKVPVWQKEILRRARRRGRFAITATQMLESMITSPVPTRAEVSDVANAIFDGTDAIMLSAETAVGHHPVEAVRTMSRIAHEVETDQRSIDLGESTLPEDAPADRPLEALIRAAVELARDTGARWIVNFTLHGRTAQLLAGRHCGTGILALTPFESTRRRLSASWNTRTLRIPLAENSDEMMRVGMEILRGARLVRSGDTLIIVAGDAGMAETTNLLRLVRVGER